MTDTEQAAGFLMTRRRAKVRPLEKNKTPKQKKDKQVRFSENPVKKVTHYVATPKESPFVARREGESDAAYFVRKSEHTDKEHLTRGNFVRDYVASIGAKTVVPDRIKTIGNMKTIINNAETSVGLKSTKVWAARSKFVQHSPNLDKHGYAMEALFWPDKYLNGAPPTPSPKLTTKLKSVFTIHRK